MLIVSAAAIICLTPLLASAQGVRNYVVAKAGVYTPGSSDLTSNGADFGTGFNGEIAMGHYLNPNIAAELGIGWFRTTDTIRGVDNEIRVVPVTVTLKVLSPMGNFEPYVAAGAGWYFCHAEFGHLRIQYSDDDNTGGVHVGVGANYDLTPYSFVGIEGKYLWANPELTIDGITADTAIDGLIVTANLGIRF